ncbi:MAG: alpha/beta hydrolase [Rhodospirillales bacterium CG15_BIG_FIL_POST_REV_8_21_14_020_66_15]|nr:MAG: alpha/beta hydrolase [Rhodospirillales bacterium CG15_BIG_FIL_POST_REV_8_21_14_020_66_15]
MLMVGQVIAAAAAVYGLLVGLLFFGQRSLMYQPGDAAGTPAAAGLIHARAVRVRTEDGLDLLSWYLAPGAGRAVVLYFHGNAGTIADRAYKARILAEQGLGVMLAEYRGYGGNPGRPTEAGLYADARANLAWLAAQGHGPEGLVIYGESLGTGVAVQAAFELARAGTPVRGLVLESPFTSMADAAGHHYPWVPAGRLTRDRYDSKAKIAAVRAPVLVVHGAEDRTVPMSQGRALFDLAAEPKTGVWLPGAGHADVFDHGAGEAVLGFIGGLGGGA